MTKTAYKVPLLPPWYAGLSHMVTPLKWEGRSIQAVEQPLGDRRIVLAAQHQGGGRTYAR